MHPSSYACIILILLRIHPYLVLGLDIHVYRLIFSTFAKELTAWATEHMYQKFEKLQWDYDIGEYATRGGRSTVLKSVTSKRHGDKFVVTPKFECFHSPDSPKVGSYVSACKQCWNQVYSGLLCIHCLLVLADKVTHTKRLRDKESICQKAVEACHKHWHRSSYPQVVGTSNYAHLPNTEKIFARVISDQLGGQQVRENRIVVDVSPGSSPVSRSSSDLSLMNINSRSEFRSSRFRSPRHLARVSRETFMNHVVRVAWSASAACRRRTMSMHSSSFSSASSLCNVRYGTTVCASRSSTTSSVYRGNESPTHSTWSRGPASFSTSSSCVQHRRWAPSYSEDGVNNAAPSEDDVNNAASSADDVNNSAPSTSGRKSTGGRKSCRKSLNQLFTLSELDNVQLRNPRVRQKKQKSKKTTSKRRPNRRKRKPNTGSQETEDDKDTPTRRRKKAASKKSVSKNHQRVHDEAVARVIRPIMNPREKDFSAKELISMINHLGLIIPDTGMTTRPNKKGRFQCWLRHYNSNMQYRRQCFTKSRVVALGTHVAKYFGTDIYSGTLKSKMRDETGIVYWRVSYYDGDEEDLNNIDVLTAIKLHENLQDQKRMNEFMD